MITGMHLHLPHMFVKWHHMTAMVWYGTGANLPICSTDIPDIPTFFISQENILGYEYYHKTHGDNKTTH
jgi:hypothetical protein